MDEITAYLCLAAAAILLPPGPPLRARPANELAERPSDRIDGIRVDGVIYYDAPIRRAALIVR